jgi:hypothetical protein
MKVLIALVIGLAMALLFPWWANFALCIPIGHVLGQWPRGATFGPLLLMRREDLDHITIAGWRLSTPILAGQHHWYIGAYAVGPGDRKFSGWWPRLVSERTRLHGTALTGRGWYLLTQLGDLQFGYSRNTGATVEL